MPNSSTTDDITVDGSAKSTVPSLSFCSSSLSLPSWLEPKYDHRVALFARASLARSANSLADISNSEPGRPDVAELELGLRLGRGEAPEQDRGDKRDETAHDVASFVDLPVF